MRKIYKIQLLKINLVEDIAEDEELDILGTVKEYKRKIKESKRNKKDNEYLLKIINNIDCIRFKKKDKRIYELLYKKWTDMKQRCYNTNNKDYSYYGKRGITVCVEWLNSFVDFFKWSLDNGYNPTNTNTIDRIDSNKGYSPDNCRYTTFLYNTSYINGKEYTHKDLSSVKLYFKARQNNNNLEYETVKSRIKAGWKEKDIITKKVEYHKVSIKNLESFIKHNTNLESMRKLYKRFLLDNKDNIDILEKGQRLYNNYINQAEKNNVKCKWKQYYLTKRLI